MKRQGWPTIPWPAVLPRLITAVWAGWCASTAYAYIDETPRVLQATQDFLHIEVWQAWAFTTVTLLLGTLAPPRGPRWLLWLGTVLRLGGMAMCAGLLLAWATEFFFTDMNRGWVTGKNYLMLAWMALLTALVVSVNRFDMLKSTQVEDTATTPGE